jgi:hypothetical protein
MDPVVVYVPKCVQNDSESLGLRMCGLGKIHCSHFYCYPIKVRKIKCVSVMFILRDDIPVSHYDLHFNIGQFCNT